MNQLREDSLLASYTPDIAGEIDGDHADLIERFAELAKGWKGVLPTTRLMLEKAMVDTFIKGLQAGLLDGAMEAGRQEANRFAAIAMFQVLDMLIEHERPDMLKVCLGIAIGAESRSQTEVAEEFGVERATISKWCRRLVEVLNLVPGRGMRRPEAVQAYRDRQAKVWRDRFEEQRKEAA